MLYSSNQTSFIGQSIKLDLNLNLRTKLKMYINQLNLNSLSSINFITFKRFNITSSLFILIFLFITTVSGEFYAFISNNLYI